MWYGTSWTRSASRRLRGSEQPSGESHKPADRSRRASRPQSSDCASFSTISQTWSVIFASRPLPPRPKVSPPPVSRNPLLPAWKPLSLVPWPDPVNLPTSELPVALSAPPGNYSSRSTAACPPRCWGSPDPGTACRPEPRCRPWRRPVRPTGRPAIVPGRTIPAGSGPPRPRRRGRDRPTASRRGGHGSVRANRNRGVPTSMLSCRSSKDWHTPNRLRVSG